MMAQKDREVIYVIYLNFQKDFYTVPHDKLMFKVRLLGKDKKLVR